MSILLFIIVLALLILVHELGHFIAAKRSGVQVDEFGIGFPPRLFGKKIGETMYSINLFPVGGFVKILGETVDEDFNNKANDSSRRLNHKSRFIQIWVLSAGVIFNLLFAWMLLSWGFMIGVPFPADDQKYGARVENPALVITQVLTESPAENAGLKTGDNIVALYAGADILEAPTISTTQEFISSHKEIVLAYLRDKEIKTVTILPQEGLVEGHSAVGISMDFAGILKLPIHEALLVGLSSTAAFTWSTTIGLLDFFKNIFAGQADFSNVAGPVGIASIVGDVATSGLVNLLTLVAIISINLAIINLFPFPALDGGRILFVLIEAIKRSPLKPVVANTLNGVGFLLLILLMIVVTYHDIARLIHG